MTGSIIHGGNLTEALRRYPQAPAPLIDLSTGINPVPYPHAPLPPGAFTRLPDPASVLTLQAAAARAYGVADPAMLVAAPGTQVLISLLPRLLPQPAIAVLGPTYAEHAAAWRLPGTRVHDATEIGELTHHRAAVLCNPNNPDGRRWSPGHLAGLAARLDLLVIDEAFADFEPGVSAAALAGMPNLLILRSFGKAYGLAGIRLGFAIAAVPVAAMIRDAIGPWAVSGPAIAIAGAALADTAWARSAARRLRQDAARLDAALADAGCEPAGGTSLFRLVRTPDAAGLAEFLGRQGILVRSFAERPGLLRFGIPAPDEWDRVLAALAAWAGGATAPSTPASAC